MGALQPGHLIVLLIIVLLVFGPGKLPELGKAVGDGLRELKRATSGDHTPEATAEAAAPLQAATTQPCPHCSVAVKATDKFCGACGKAVVAAGAGTLS